MYKIMCPELKCPKCGTINEKIAPDCSNCGYKFEEATLNYFKSNKKKDTRKSIWFLMSAVLGLCALISLIGLILGAALTVFDYFLYISIVFGALGGLIFISLMIALMSKNLIAKHIGESFDDLSIAVRFEKNLNILRNPENFQKSDIRIAARVMINMLFVVILGIVIFLAVVAIMLLSIA